MHGAWRYSPTCSQKARAEHMSVKTLHLPIFYTSPSCVNTTAGCNLQPLGVCLRQQLKKSPQSLLRMAKAALKVTTDLGDSPAFVLWHQTHLGEASLPQHNKHDTSNILLMTRASIQHAMVSGRTDMISLMQWFCCVMNTSLSLPLSSRGHKPWSVPFCPQTQLLIGCIQRWQTPHLSHDDVLCLCNCMPTK